MRVKVKVPLKTKSGTVFEVGEAVSAAYHDKRDGYVRITSDDGRTCNIRVEVVNKKLTGFTRCPSIKTLSKWSFDGVAKSLTGKKVEPDGVDPLGFPSWLRALSYI